MRCARALAALAGHRRDGSIATRVVRLPIDRAFTMRGFGAVVTGTLVSGPIAVGDTLTVLPDGHWCACAACRCTAARGGAPTRRSASR